MVAYIRRAQALFPLLRLCRSMEYEHIELPAIWKTEKNDLPLLKTAVLRALNPPGPSAG